MFLPKALLRPTLVALILVLLLPSFSTLAQEDEQPLGSVFESVVYGSSGSDEFTPFASQSLPGGGQGVATAGIQWYAIRIDALAISEIQNATAYYNIFARVQSFNRNGVLKCSQSSLTGPSGVTGNHTWTTACNVFEGPYGATWENNTEHLFQGGGGFNWNPTVYVSQTL